MSLLYIFIFWVISSLICSIQFSAIKDSQKNSKFISIILNVSKFIENKQKKLSSSLMLKIFDNTKCLVFVVLAAVLFNNKYITDITAIFTHLSDRYPVFNKFKNESKNFINIIITGFILDQITGISMLLAFIIGAKKSGYTSVAICSAMLAGIIKTSLHLFIFNHNDYIEALFFLLFGCLAISKNKKTLIYICEKAVPKDFKFFKKKEQNDCKNKVKENQKTNITNKKHKDNVYPDKYKKFYKNNKKYEKADIKAEKKDFKNEKMKSHHH